jgi:hypothetical protein
MQASPCSGTPGGSRLAFEWCCGESPRLSASGISDEFASSHPTPMWPSLSLGRTRTPPLLFPWAFLPRSLPMSARALPHRTRDEHPAAGTRALHADEPPTGILPTWRAALEPRGPYLLPLLLLLAARLAAWAALPHAGDDAYITFRYARHLAWGHGLVYNPGQRVLGVSSVPWTLWCAVSVLLHVSPVVWTRLTSLVADAVTLLLVGRALERDADGGNGGGRAAALIFTMFFAGWPFFAAVSMSGMENSAMLALIALGAALARARSALAGPTLGLLALWRPEGVVAAALLATGARARDRLVALGILAAGAAALTLAFGSPIPQSVLAKSSLYGTPGPLAGRQWWDWLVPVMLGAPPVSGEGRALFPLAVLFAPAAVVGAGRLARRPLGATALAALACVAIWAGYAALGVAYFFWYLAVPLGGLAMLAAAGLPRLLRGRAVYAALALLVASAWLQAWPLYVGRAQNEEYGFGNAAAFLRAYARPGEKVMLEPIGMVGYDCPLVVVDEVGLVSPAVARRRLEGPGWYSDVVASERPDWLVVRQGVLLGGRAFAGAGAPFRSPAERDGLFQRYRVATRIDTVSGDQSFVVLRRAE